MVRACGNGASLPRAGVLSSQGHHSFIQQIVLEIRRVPVTVLGTGLPEVSTADTALRPGAAVLAGETHRNLSAPVKVSQNPPAVGAELTPE